MSIRETDNALEVSLERLENALVSPVLPGELPQWCGSARAACDAVEQHLPQQISHTHEEIFKQILEEDRGLAARVKEMRDEDQRILAEQEQVDEYLTHLEKIAADVEPHESKIDEQVKKAVDKGLEFVLAVRKQETAVSTWYVEALERDRGIVD